MLECRLEGAGSGVANAGCLTVGSLDHAPKIPCPFFGHLSMEVWFAEHPRDFLPLSIKAMTAVWDLKLPPNQSYVLLALADHAHDDGTNVYPSLRRVAWKTGYTRRQVRRIITDLRDAGVVVVDGDLRPGRTTKYWIDFSAVKRKESFTQVGQDVLGGRTPTSQGVGHPRPTIEPSTNRNRKMPVKKRKTQLSDTWQPTETHQERARALKVDLDLEAEKFRNHATATARIQVNWNSAFANWLISAHEYSKNGKGRQPDTGALKRPTSFELKRAGLL